MGGTTAHGGLGVIAGRNAVHQRLGQAGEVRFLPTHDEFRPAFIERSGKAGILSAGVAGAGGVSANGDPDHAQPVRNCGLNLGLGQHGHGVREVGHGIEPAPGRYDGYANPVHLAVEQVGAVPRGRHPALVNGGCAGTHGHGLFNEAEMGSGMAGPLRQFGLTAVTVRNGPLGGHAQTVGESSGSQGRVPLERSNPLSGTGLVGQLEQLLFPGADSLGTAQPCIRGQGSRRGSVGQKSLGRQNRCHQRDT